MPKIPFRPDFLPEISAGRRVRVTEKVPHGVVEGTARHTLHCAHAPLGVAAGHQRVEASDVNHGGVVGIHVEIANDQSSCMTTFVFDALDELSGLFGNESLIRVA
jgi:hypothetical protein